MLSEENAKHFVRGSSLYRILQPWWDVVCHYLCIIMLMIAMFGGTLQFLLHRIICVPCQTTSDRLCEGRFVNQSMSESQFSYLHLPRTHKLDVQQYNYVDSICYEHYVSWFVKFFPYLVMVQTLALVVVSNFWLKYPSTCSRLQHFVAILQKCCDSPWTTRALSECAAKQGGNQTTPKLCDSNGETATDREKKPIAVNLLSSLNKKEAEQAKALFEKVKKLKVHVEGKDMVYYIYMKQIIAKMILSTLTLIYVLYASTWMLHDVACKVNLYTFIPVQVFHCIFPLASIFWFLSLFYTLLLVVYFLACFYGFLWMIRNSLKQYSFDVTLEESKYNDIPDVKNDFAFIFHLLDKYNPLLSKQFAVFLSEVSERKLRQLDLNNIWPLDKLVPKVVKTPNEQVELHLMLLSGIPDAVFEIKELEVLKLQSILDPRLPPKITQLGKLKELWLDNSPASVDHNALDFLTKNLRILRLKFTDAEKAPRWIFSLRNLNELYLYGGLLSDDKQAFISGIRSLKELKILFIKCSISYLPRVITHAVPSIQKLLVDNEGTPFRSAQSLRAMSHLTCLELLNCDLQRIPSSVFYLRNLQEIDLKGNNLKTIEEIVSFQHFPRLFLLKLECNSITHIPVHIGCLKTLGQLHLSRNFISSLPGQLFQCSRLYHLDLSHNKLSAIPDEIQDMERLQTLNLSNNNIAALPEGLFKCTTLQLLILDHNNLKTVSAQVGKLTNLTLLDLRKNQLECLAPELEECLKLRPNGLLVEMGLLNTLPPDVKECFQRTEKENLSQHETDAASSANTAG
ncbi:volume-regulated anion channel subunit LRRC8A-like [Trichomycterus rosablanca]|uniref:volume-regulated anion channel subunit LRRC8A-like n=1 Tax=Trichomycterus rosablanca TaxID=2290929 RepID=UPI002F35155F